MITAASSGGTLLIDPTTFTNNGAIDISSGETVTIEPTNFTNAATGGIAVGANSTLILEPGGSWSLGGTTNGAGTLDLASGTATIGSGAEVSVSHWSISGAGTDVTLDENLTYSGAFSEGARDTLVLSGGHLLLNGADTFSGGTVDGSKLLETEGTTTVSGLTIGGTEEWENTKSVTQSGGTVTIGDSSRDKAFLDNISTGTYDISGAGAIGRGSSTASYIDNVGLIEKTGGTGESTIAPYVINSGTLKVTAATLDLKAGVYGTGKDIISGASTLEFDSIVKAGQTASFTGSGGELALHDSSGFAGLISGFDTAGAGSNDTIEVAGPWVFTRFTENSGGTQGTLGFMNGASTLSLMLIGDYNRLDFVHKLGPNGSTLITYT
jgi:hypothetical protein